jgi:hypothetical protein
MKDVYEVLRQKELESRGWKTKLRHYVSSSYSVGGRGGGKAVIATRGK